MRHTLLGRSVIIALVAASTVPLSGLVAQATAPSAPSSATISADVEQQLAADSPGSMITVIVKFRQQADTHRRRSGTRQQRQRSLIDEMHAVADNSQQPMRLLLTARQRDGEVSTYQSLWAVNGFSVTATSNEIVELSHRSEVESITSDVVNVVSTSLPPNPATASASAVVVHAPALWSQGFYGQGVVVADLDSGVDATHPDLVGSYRGGSNSWFDPYAQHVSPTDLSGHGTATTGIIVGGDTSGATIGVAPGAKWIAAKIFNDAGTATATAIHQAMQWVLDPDGNPSTADAPHIVNNSWAFGNPGCNLQFQPDLQAMRAAGIIPVFAAGNYGPNANTSVSPANYPEALAVGSTDNTDAIDPITSEGPSACGEASTTYPDLVAPGYDIYTTDLHGFYQYGSGTSFAAPHVAGALALLLSAQPTAGATVESALTNTAVDLGAAGVDNVYGRGRIDVAAALQLLQTTTTTSTTTTSTTVPATTTTTDVPTTTTDPTTTTVPATTTTTDAPTTTTSTTLPPTTTTIQAVSPTLTGLTVTPNATNGSAMVALAATATADSSLIVSGAEFFTDTVGAPGAGRPMVVGAGNAVNATLSVADIGSLADGTHTISARSQDSSGVWSALASATLLVDRTGPTFASLAITPSTAVAGGTTLVTATIGGASDSSGVAGGEYWVGATAPPPGSGSAFTGAAPVLPVSSPAAGSYTVSVRLRDTLGNWGAPRSATLTVTAPGFADGFESGTLPGAWTRRSTTSTSRLSVTAGAALTGAFGLRAQGNDANYVQYNLASPAPIYDVKFSFRPNGNTSLAQIIFATATSNTFATNVYRVRYRLSGGVPQVQLLVGSTNNTTWANLLGGTANNTIEVVWQAANSGGPSPGTVQLVVNGVLAQSLSTTSTAAPAAIRLGSVSNGSSFIAEYFDAFASKTSATPLLGS
jgi:subtilisin family serine protease